MRKNRWYKIFACIVTAVFLLLHGFAQPNYKYAVSLADVERAGFYRVDLLPNIVSLLQPGFQDLRIFDQAGRQVPYVFEQQNLVIHPDSIRELPIVTSRNEKDSQAYVEIENTMNVPVSSLVLFVRNTDASRIVSISGSDNRNDWYIVKENIVLANLNSPQHNGVSLTTLTFPISTYRFFKITLHSKETLPVNIIRAGIPLAPVSEPKVFIPLPAPTILQKDSTNGFTYVDVKFLAPQRIHKLSLELYGNKFFRRKLFVEDTEFGFRRYEFIINSNETASYEMDLHSRRIQIRIENHDNPPLKISAVEAYQLRQSVIVWLEKGSGYRIVFGDSQAVHPRYDLAYFKDSIRNNVTLLAQGNIEEIGGPRLTAKEDSAYGRIWLWMVLGTVLAILLLFSFRLTRDISK